MIKGFARKYFEGKKCIFCDKYGLYRLKDRRVKCEHCKRKYSIIKLRKDMQILYYFYLEVSARKAARELNFDYETVHGRFMQFRKSIVNYCQKEEEILRGELELDESYFGGKRKGKRGRGAGNKAIVFGIIKNESS